MSIENINALTPENCMVALIDHQPFVAFPIESIDRATLINNSTALAKVAAALELPVVLSTISATGGPLVDPLLSSIAAVFPDVEPIDRRTTNAWSDPAFRAAVEATGRRKLVMAGLWTEVCLAQTALSALRDGYEVFFVSDASGGMSVEAHQDAKTRMVQAGAIGLTWMALSAELEPDSSQPAYQALYPITIEHGGGLSIAVQYTLAQLQAGTVAMPA